MSDDVRRSLQRIQAPDEIDAQRRAWALVRASFDTREPVSWQRRNRRPLLVVALALLVAAGRVRLAARPSARRKRARCGHARRAHVEAEARADRAARRWIAPRQLEQRPVDRPSRRVEATARPLVGRRLVAERRARRGHARASPRGAHARRDDPVGARPAQAAPRCPLVARATERVLPNRVHERQAAARRRRRRHRRRSAEERRRPGPARVEARRHPPGRVLDDRRPHRARRRGHHEDDLAQRSGRPADPARLVGRRPAPARPRRALPACVRLEREQAVGDRDARGAFGSGLRPQEPPVHP